MFPASFQHGQKVVTATTATKLTSTATLLQITPTSYGVAVTLPDATTCTEGGPLHIIDNRGAYPVRVLNNSGTLLGFVFGGVVSHVSLIDNSSAAGTWTIENSELVGASAQLLTTNLISFSSVTFGGGTINLGSGRELLVGANAAQSAIYGVVYDSTSNSFGSVTLIRSTASVGSGTCYASALVSTDKVIVVSCPSSGGTAFEAVVLTMAGTTITVNTAATDTLSAAMTGFADGCGLIAVGSSFVCSYTVSGPAAQIRALSISGTTVTIGSASVLDGTAGGLIAVGDSTHVIAASTATTHLYTKPYLVSGSTLTAGTGTDTNSGTMTLNKLAALGTRWYVGYNDGGSTVKGGVVSLNATGNGTTTISAATLFSAGTLQDAIVIGSTVLALNNQATSNANILTDSSGTASAGTAITTDDNTAKACLYASSTDVAIMSGNTTRRVMTLDCSGASPVLSKKRQVSSAQITPNQTASNSVLSRTPVFIFGTAFAQSLPPTQNTSSGLFTVKVASGECSLNVSVLSSFGGSQTEYRGKSDSERWVTEGATVITKLECVS